VVSWWWGKGKEHKGTGGGGKERNIKA
jgi:hypothetical protein